MSSGRSLGNVCQFSTAIVLSMGHCFFNPPKMVYTLQYRIVVKQPAKTGIAISE